jgi:site-specific DNA-cytosine methylase
MTFVPDTFQTLRDPNGTFGDALPAVAYTLRRDPGGTGQGHNTNLIMAVTSGGGKPGQGYGAVRIDSGVRRLTPVECERLQGLPDDWTQVPDTAPDSRRYAGLGDAVTSPVAEWIGARILAQQVAA